MGEVSNDRNGMDISDIKQTICNDRGEIASG